MTQTARGTFTVTSTNHPPYDDAEGATLARRSLAKAFTGALTGESQVEMIGAISATRGSAGYVAIERVQGSLDGRAGTFVLQHSGLMDRGASSLTVSVVPDSATGELVGLRGAMQIDVEGGEHRYTLDYSFVSAPETPAGA